MYESSLLLEAKFYSSCRFHQTPYETNHGAPDEVKF